MKLSKALVKCCNIANLPSHSGIGEIASVLAKRNGITVTGYSAMKALVMGVASRHSNVVPIRTAKTKYKAGPNNDRFYLSKAWRQLRYVALKNCDGRCQCCGASAQDGIRMHVDHIKPRSKYQNLELVLANLQVLCEDCNIGKSNIDDTDWRHFKSI